MARTASPAPAKLAAPPAPKPAPPAPTKVAAPSTTQAGGPALRIGQTPSGELAPGVLDLQRMGSEFKPPGPIAAFLDSQKKSRVETRLGAMAQGPIEVETLKPGRYRIKRQRLPLNHPLLARASQVVPGLVPMLQLDTEGEQLRGRVAFIAGERSEAIDALLRKTPDLLGLAGFSLGGLGSFVNQLDAGRLRFGFDGAPITLGQAFSGKLSVMAEDNSVRFEGQVMVALRGANSGGLTLKRNAEGQVTGKASLALTLSKSLSGSLEVSWDGQAINGVASARHQGEKLNGSVTLRMMEREEALALEKQRKAPPEATPAAAAAPARRAAGRKVDYLLFGEGDLDFRFNDWLRGTAHVIVDPGGFVTIIGKITPQAEFELFPQKDYVRQLFKLEVRASYGLPVVGNVFVFGNVGMDAFAKLGPGRFYKIIAQGTYSTDPRKCQDFSIQGSLNISAAAGMRLRAEGGVGVEILGHDIKAGAGVNGIAGVKGYVEATPIIGYRETAQPGQDKKGEWFLRGELEMAAQPFLGLSGDLFIELDAPWWSPLDDDKWTWPLFGKEWPLGGSLGMAASMDYVFGSGAWPKLELKPAEFAGDKFLTNLYEDKAKPGKGGEVSKPGAWKEKNSAKAAVPAKSPPAGNARRGKPAALPAPGAKGKGGGKGKARNRPVDPEATTKGGKKVKQLQDEAAKKGRKPPGGDAGGKGRKGDADKKKGDKAAPIDATAQLLKEDEGFTAHDGKGHRIFFEPGRKDGTLVVESKRSYLTALIDKFPKNAKSRPHKAAAEAARKKVVELIREGRSAKTPELISGVASKIDAQLKIIAKALTDAGVMSEVVVPAPTYHFATESAKVGGARAKSAEVKNLSAVRPMGSTPGSASPAGWLFAQQAGLTVDRAPYLRRLHLINHRFGGPGMNQNLAVAGQQDNSEHEKEAEHKIKEIVGEMPNASDAAGVVTSYKVVAVYARPDEALQSAQKTGGAKANLNDFPSAFLCTWEHYELAKPDKKKKGKADLTFGDWADKLRQRST